ncbi:unnamed protein product [Soboliphyme baturini]|uniref:Uncharacterized protein n=1 Tax=Soboliphyme baturini TaxID=241478 RepID=A0A183JAY0_9BILA|nr:unnamed protein product [Soboliphyme baturini]
MLFLNRRFSDLQISSISLLQYRLRKRRRIR